MSDQLKHECGIALVHLKKPLNYYNEKYGSHMYGIDKMFLMMEKQKNRGQDGAGFASLKLDLKPGDKYFYRVRSFDQQAIHSVFKRINKKITQFLKLEKVLKYLAKLDAVVSPTSGMPSEYINIARLGSLELSML